jgi:hypothetical protein
MSEPASPSQPGPANSPDNAATPSHAASSSDAAPKTHHARRMRHHAKSASSESSSSSERDATRNLNEQQLQMAQNGSSPGKPMQGNAMQGHAMQAGMQGKSNAIAMTPPSQNSQSKDTVPTYMSAPNANGPIGAAGNPVPAGSNLDQKQNPPQQGSTPNSGH